MRFFHLWKAYALLYFPKPISQIIFINTFFIKSNHMSNTFMKCLFFFKMQISYDTIHISSFLCHKQHNELNIHTMLTLTLSSSNSHILPNSLKHIHVLLLIRIFSRLRFYVHISCSHNDRHIIFMQTHTLIYILFTHYPITMP